MREKKRQRSVSPAPGGKDEETKEETKEERPKSDDEVKIEEGTEEEVVVQKMNEDSTVLFKSGRT